MAIQNYWWLLIWMFIAGGFSIVFAPQQQEIVLGQKCYRWNRISAVLLALPFAVWAGWRPDKFGDTGMYRARFQNIAAGVSNIIPYVRGQAKDRGYAFLEAAFKSLISQSDKLFLFSIALLQLLCLVYIYRKFSRNYWLSMFMFVASTDYLSWMHNGMRQFIAVTIIFAALPLLIKKRYLLVTIAVLIAVQVHLSALICLPFIFIVNGRAWNMRTVAFIIFVLLGVLFIDRVTGFITDAMMDTAYEGDIQIFIEDDGTNIFRVLFYSVPAIMSLFFRRYIHAADDPVVNVCTNLSIVAAGFYLFSYYTSGILIGRLPIYFSLANYILIPWLITEVFSPSSALLMDAVFVGVYTSFYYYQVGVTWGLL